MYYQNDPRFNGVYMELIGWLCMYQQFRLKKISKIEDYFITEIKKRELMNKKLSKYISFFDYFDKSLIVWSVASGSISIASFAAVIGIPVGIASASLSLAFSL